MIVTDEILRLSLLIANDVVSFESHAATFLWQRTNEVRRWHYSDGPPVRIDSSAAIHLLEECERFVADDKDVLAELDEAGAEASVLIAPGNELVGVFKFYRPQLPFSTHELWLFGLVKDLLDASLCSPSALELLKSLHIEFLHQRVFSRSADPDEILKTYVQKAAFLIHPERFDPLRLRRKQKKKSTDKFRVDAKLIGPNRTELQIRSTLSAPKNQYKKRDVQTPYRIHNDNTIASRVFQSERPYLCNDLSQEQDLRTLFPDSSSHMSVPILYGEERVQGEVALPQCLGVITCETTTISAYSSVELSALALLAAHAAWPLGRAMIHREVDRLARERRAVQHAITRLQQCSREAQVFESLENTFVELQYTRGLVCKVDHSSNEIIGIHSWTGKAMEQLMAKTRRHLDKDSSDCQCLAVLERESQIIRDPRSDERVNPEARDVAGLKHFAVVPVINSHGVVSYTIHVEREDLAPLSESADLPLLEELARFTNDSIERIQLSDTQTEWIRSCLSGVDYSEPWQLLSRLADLAIASGICSRCRVYQILDQKQTGVYQAGTMQVTNFSQFILDGKIKDNARTLKCLKSKKKPVLVISKESELPLHSADFEVRRYKSVPHERKLKKRGLTEWVEAPIQSQNGVTIGKIVFDHQGTAETRFTPEELKWIANTTIAACMAIDTHGSKELLAELAQEGLAADVLRHAIRDVVTMAINDLHDRVEPLRVYRKANDGLNALKALGQPNRGHRTLGEEMGEIARLVSPFLQAGEIRIEINGLADAVAHEESKDAASLAMVLLKIVANSVRAVNRAAESGSSLQHEVLLGLRKTKDGRYCVSCRDTGNGLPRAVLRALNEPVNIISGSHGEGRGLAYVRMLCKRSGWELKHRRRNGRTTFDVVVSAAIE